ncbi:MAG: hypothetical protein IJ512_02185 [Ruminococcus sp.]|nr:hypothetical protein [Ruminococcus sp.]
MRKKSRKIIITIAAAVFLVLGLIPMKYGLDDGGTIGYSAVFYEVIFWHQLDESSPTGYYEETEIRIFPMNCLGCFECY